MYVSLLASTKAGAQSMIPLSMTVISDTILNKAEIQQKRIKRVKCVHTNLRFDKSCVDTQRVWLSDFDSLFRVVKNTYLFFSKDQSGAVDSSVCTITYHGNYAIEHCKRTKKEYVTTTEGGREVAFKVFEIKDSVWYLTNNDTFIYQDNRLTQEIRMLYGYNKNIVADSIITLYVYDSIGRIKTKTMLAPAIFRSGLQKAHSGYPFDRSITEYSYFTDYTRAVEYEYARYHKGAKIIQDDIIKKTQVDNRLRLQTEKSQIMDDDSYYIYLNDKYNIIEYHFSEVLFRNNKKGSSLPEKITATSGDIIEIFNFFYEN